MASGSVTSMRTGEPAPNKRPTVGESATQSGPFSGRAGRIKRHRLCSLQRRIADLSGQVEAALLEGRQLVAWKQAQASARVVLSEEERAVMEEGHIMRMADIVQKACLPVVRELMKHRFSFPFNAPVDTVRFPDYPKIITHPMDLATLRSRCEAGMYRGPRELYADLTLIFSNAKRFNPAGSDCFVMAQGLQEFAQEKWDKLVVPRMVEEKAIKMREETACLARKREAMYAQEVEVVEQQAEKLLAYLEELHTAVSEAKSLAASLVEPVAPHEREALAADLMTLPTPQLEGAVAFVAMRKPELKHKLLPAQPSMPPPPAPMTSIKAEPMTATIKTEAGAGSAQQQMDDTQSALLHLHLGDFDSLLLRQLQHLVVCCKASPFATAATAAATSAATASATGGIPAPHAGGAVAGAASAAGSAAPGRAIDVAAAGAAAAAATSSSGVPGSAAAAGDTDVAASSRSAFATAAADAADAGAAAAAPSGVAACAANLISNNTGNTIDTSMPPPGVSRASNLPTTTSTFVPAPPSGMAAVALGTLTSTMRSPGPLSTAAAEPHTAAVGGLFPLPLPFPSGASAAGSPTASPAAVPLPPALAASIASPTPPCESGAAPAATPATFSAATMAQLQTLLAAAMPPPPPPARATNAEPSTSATHGGAQLTTGGAPPTAGAQPTAGVPPAAGAGVPPAVGLAPTTFVPPAAGLQSAFAPATRGGGGVHHSLRTSPTTSASPWLDMTFAGRHRVISNVLSDVAVPPVSSTAGSGGTATAAGGGTISRKCGVTWPNWPVGAGLVPTPRSSLHLAPQDAPPVAAAAAGGATAPLLSAPQQQQGAANVLPATSPMHRLGSPGVGGQMSVGTASLTPSHSLAGAGSTPTAGLTTGGGAGGTAGHAALPPAVPVAGRAGQPLRPILKRKASPAYGEGGELLSPAAAGPSDQVVVAKRVRSVTVRIPSPPPCSGGHHLTPAMPAGDAAAVTAARTPGGSSAAEPVPPAVPAPRLRCSPPAADGLLAGAAGQGGATATGAPRPHGQPVAGGGVRLTSAAVATGGGAAPPSASAVPPHQQQLQHHVRPAGGASWVPPPSSGPSSAPAPAALRMPAASGGPVLPYGLLGGGTQAVPVLDLTTPLGSSGLGTSASQQHLEQLAAGGGGLLGGGSGSIVGGAGGTVGAVGGSSNNGQGSSGVGLVAPLGRWPGTPPHDGATPSEGLSGGGGGGGRIVLDLSNARATGEAEVSDAAEAHVPPGDL